MHKSTLLRPVWLPTAVTAGLLLLAMSLLVGISWRNSVRLESIYDRAAQVSKLQAVALRLQDLLVDHVILDHAIEPQALAAIGRELQRIEEFGLHDVTEARDRLRGAQKALANGSLDPRKALITSLQQIRTVFATESVGWDNVLARLRRTTALEFDIALATFVAFPLVIVLTLYLLRKRIVSPLLNLADLMAHLGRRDYNAVHSGAVDPLIKPLIDRYNGLVSRLAALEQANRQRQQLLERQIRNATYALLEQQRDLANAERLASVGEVAAALAHELRNPLAGIQLALGNLRRDTDDHDHAERLHLVGQEVTRVVGILNEVLNRSRHVPETAVDVKLAHGVEELLTLVRYQLPAGIRVDSDIPPQLTCHLPERRTRQAILNLVLNAAQAMEDRNGIITVGAEMRDDRVLISVCDDGPGFPQHLVENVVRPFVTGRTDGTGLGLAMVRRFASDAGGGLQLSNRVPRGACATLNLPCPKRDG